MAYTVFGELSTCESLQSLGRIQRIRTRNACFYCRKKKAKCSGGTPCNKCVADDRICEYNKCSARVRRRGKACSPEYAEHLEEQHEKMCAALRVAYKLLAGTNKKFDEHLQAHGLDLDLNKIVEVFSGHYSFSEDAEISPGDESIVSMPDEHTETIGLHPGQAFAFEGKTPVLDGILTPPDEVCSSPALSTSLKTTDGGQDCVGEQKAPAQDGIVIPADKFCDSTTLSTLRTNPDGGHNCVPCDIFYRSAQHLDTDRWASSLQHIDFSAAIDFTSAYSTHSFTSSPTGSVLDIHGADYARSFGMDEYVAPIDRMCPSWSDGRYFQ